MLPCCCNIQARKIECTEVGKGRQDPAMTHASSSILRTGCCLLLLAGFIRPALAGPPYQADDPEPTDYRHFEIYTFNKGSFNQAGASGASGIDVNYGAAENLQLTAVLPADFSVPTGGPNLLGLGNVELAAKYRFLRQDSFGLNVSVFPRAFLPSPSQLGDQHASLLLPVWIEKDWGKVTAFGGGGCQFSFDTWQRTFCMYGGVVTRQVLDKLQLGVELFHQTSDSSGAPPSTTIGLGAKYDIDDHYHLLGYVADGLQNPRETGAVSWYASVLFTF